MTSSILISAVVSALFAACVVHGGVRKCGGNQPPLQTSHCPPCVHSQCSPGLMLPFPGNCSKFCKCDHGFAVAFDCPDGLHFDPRAMVCDWPRPGVCQAVVDGCKNVEE